MTPENFAKQFFDLWQQSASQMMQDPAFSQKMLDLWQESNQQWQTPHANSAFNMQANTKAESTQNHAASPAPASPNDRAGAISADELADRLAQCEQRIAELEAKLAPQPAKQPSNGSAAS